MLSPRYYISMMDTCCGKIDRRAVWLLVGLLLLAGCALEAEPAPPAATVEPTMTVLPVESVSPEPTASPLPSTPESESGSQRSSLLSPKVTLTPEPPAFYRGKLVSWEPNCAGSQIKGRVVDARGSPLPAVTVQVLLFDEQFGPFPVTNPEGRFEFNRFHIEDALAPVEYEVAVIDDESGEVISNVLELHSNSTDCEPGGSGHQVATLYFIRDR